MRHAPPLSPIPFPLMREGEISVKLGICGSEATAYTQFYGLYPLAVYGEGARGWGDILLYSIC
jgi:hypothetical protein